MVKFRNSGGGLSDNLQDRRAMGGRGIAAGGGIVGVVVLVVLFQLLGGGGGGGGTGIDINDVFNQINTGGSSGTVDPADEPLVEEMSDALDDIQGFWGSERGRRRRLPRRHPRAVHGRGEHRRMRERPLVCRTVLLPPRREGVHRPVVLRAARRPVRGPRRLRPGVRDCP